MQLDYENLKKYVNTVLQLEKEKNGAGEHLLKNGEKEGFSWKVCSITRAAEKAKNRCRKETN